MHSVIKFSSESDPEWLRNFLWCTSRSTSCHRIDISNRCGAVSAGGGSRAIQDPAERERLSYESSQDAFWLRFSRNACCYSPGQELVITGDRVQQYLRIAAVHVPPARKSAQIISRLHNRSPDPPPALASPTPFPSSFVQRCPDVPEILSDLLRQVFVDGHQVVCLPSLPSQFWKSSFRGSRRTTPASLLSSIVPPALPQISAKVHEASISLCLSLFFHDLVDLSQNKESSLAIELRRHRRVPIELCII